MAVSFKRPCGARRYRSFNRDAEGAAERHASPIDWTLPAAPDAERVPSSIARDPPGKRGGRNRHNCHEPTKSDHEPRGSFGSQNPYAPNMT